MIENLGFIYPKDLWALSCGEYSRLSSVALRIPTQSGNGRGGQERGLGMQDLSSLYWMVEQAQEGHLVHPYFYYFCSYEDLTAGVLGLRVENYTNQTPPWRKSREMKLVWCEELAPPQWLFFSLVAPMISLENKYDVWLIEFLFCLCIWHLKLRRVLLLFQVWPGDVKSTQT